MQHPGPQAMTTQSRTTTETAGQVEQQSRLLSIAEASQIVGCHPKTLYGRLRRGDLKSIRDAGKLKIETRELANYMRDRELVGIPAIRRGNTAKPQNKPKTTASNGTQTQPEVTGKNEEEEYRVKVGPLTLIIPGHELIRVVKGRKPETKKHEPLSTLTLTEREVYQYLQVGKRPKDIAGLLGISALTVRCHIRNIYRKLNIHSHVELINIYNKTT